MFDTILTEFATSSYVLKSNVYPREVREKIRMSTQGCSSSSVHYPQIRSICRTPGQNSAMEHYVLGMTHKIAEHVMIISHILCYEHPQNIHDGTLTAAVAVDTLVPLLVIRFLTTMAVWLRENC